MRNRYRYILVSLLSFLLIFSSLVPLAVVQAEREIAEIELREAESLHQEFSKEEQMVEEKPSEDYDKLFEGETDNIQEMDNINQKENELLEEFNEDGFEIIGPEGYEVLDFYKGSILTSDFSQVIDFLSELKEFDKNEIDNSITVDLVFHLRDKEDHRIVVFNYQEEFESLHQLHSLERIELSGNGMEILQINIDEEHQNQVVYVSPRYGFSIVYDSILMDWEYGFVENTAEIWIPDSYEVLNIKYAGKMSETETFILTKTVDSDEVLQPITFDDALNDAVELNFQISDDIEIHQVGIRDNFNRIKVGSDIPINKFLVSPGLKQILLGVVKGDHPGKHSWNWDTETLNITSNTTLTLKNEIESKLDIHVTDEGNIQSYVQLKSGDFNLVYLSDGWDESSDIIINKIDGNPELVLNTSVGSVLGYNFHDLELPSGIYEYFVTVQLPNETIEMNKTFTVFNPVQLPLGYDYERFELGRIKNVSNNEYQYFHSLDRLKQIELQKDETYVLDLILKIKRESSEDSQILYHIQKALTGAEVLSIEEIDLSFDNLNVLQFDTLDGYVDHKFNFEMGELQFSHDYKVKNSFELWLPNNLSSLHVYYGGLNSNNEAFQLYKEVEINKGNTPVTFDTELENSMKVTYKNENSEDIELYNRSVFDEKGRFLLSFPSTLQVTPSEYSFGATISNGTDIYNKIWTWKSDLININSLTELLFSEEVAHDLELFKEGNKLMSEYYLQRGDFKFQEALELYEVNYINATFTILDENNNKLFQDKNELLNEGFIHNYEIDLDELSLSQGHYNFVISIPISDQDPIELSETFTIEADEGSDNGSEGNDDNNGLDGGGSNDGGGGPSGGGGIALPPADDEETESTEQGESEEESDEPTSVYVDVAKDAKTEEQSDGTIKTTVEVEDKDITKALKKAKEVDQLVIDLSTVETDTLDIQFNSESIEAVTDKNDEAIIEIVTDEVSYRLPVEEIDLDDTAKELGVSSDDLEISIQINKLKDSKLTEEKNELDLASDVYEFNIEVTSGEESVEIEYFSQYVERVIMGDKRFDPSLSIAVRLNENGTFTPVPTMFNGKEATIKSTSNSKYVIVKNNVSFEDSNGWYQTTIEKLASKYILNGISETKFAPNEVTSRSQLAAMLVRSLDLKSNKDYASTFTDVKGTEWFVDELNAAVEAGIVKGYNDNTFKPNDLITREQAAAMIYRAMELVQFDESKLNQSLIVKDKFSDYAEISNWAKEELEVMVQTGIIGGKTENTIAPSAHATRAEVAVMIARFLQFVDFMN
ncbi:S-layer homology domain-containing protein [Chengkuizengella marina]|nr:S-layer homology domain-containing protein [Chengkuizengella marina]